MGPSLLLLATLLSAPSDPQAIWDKRCQLCHGPDGRAHTRVGQKEQIDDFTDAGWQTANTDDHIRQTILEGSRGNSRMKSFKTVLSPEEIDALVALIRAMPLRKPAEPRK